MLVLAAATVSEDEEDVSSAGASDDSAELPADTVPVDVPDDADDAEDAALLPQPAISVPASAAAQRTDTIFAFIITKFSFPSLEIFSCACLFRFPDSL